MYALQKTIGEEQVNLALRNFLNDWHTANPHRPKRYATTEELIGYFKTVTPDSLQHTITDLFERVTNSIEYYE